MKKILISGINGFLGSHLAKHLESSYEVVGLEYSLKNLYRLDGCDFKVYSTKETSLESIFKENDFYAVLHVATVYRRQDESLIQLLETNLILSVRLLELANKNNVSVFLNTDSFFNNPKYSYSYLSDYTLSKKHALEWIQLLSDSSTCKVVNMKIFHMYGEGDAANKFIPFIVGKMKGDDPRLDLTPGLQTRDFIYVKDVVTAYEFVINSLDSLSKYEEFEVGTGKSSTVKDLAITIKEVTRSSTKLNFGALPYRKGEIMKSEVESFELNKLGWFSKYTLKEGIKSYLSNE